MCAEYKSVKSNPKLLFHFGVQYPTAPPQDDSYPLSLAPFIRNARRSDAPECVAAGFGLIPSWAKDKKSARHCYNARTETVATKPSFRDAWRKAHFGIIPCEAFYEPNYESGKAVRWRISMADGEPFGIAGIWEWWPGTGDGDLLSFSMLTINANEHPLMRRFHRPDDEKRSVVILEPAHYEDWLHTTPEDAPKFFGAFPANRMAAEVDPRPVKVKPRCRFRRLLCCDSARSNGLVSSNDAASARRLVRVAKRRPIALGWPLLGHLVRRKALRALQLERRT
ncbi:MAG: SOS response-associated peptidase family protein [Candidatus Obscuribacterales bacterium]|nr:SOS response-associated peptidase family protein [Steroidobacteraceae bacterium]